MTNGPSREDGWCDKERPRRNAGHSDGQLGKDGGHNKLHSVRTGIGHQGMGGRIPVVFHNERNLGLLESLNMWSSHFRKEMGDTKKDLNKEMVDTKKDLSEETADTKRI